MQAQQKPHRSAWMFWVGLGITFAFTLGLAGIIIWLVVTQNLAQLSTLVGLIASIVAIVSAPLIFYFTVFKKPEKQEALTVPVKHETETSRTHQSETIWNIPYPHNPFFTGREQLLEDLHTYLAQASPASLTQPPAITGLGGIGKTQTAIEYANRYRGEYHYVLWVNASSLETMTEGFVSIARLVELPVKDEQGQRLVVEAVKQWLATSEHWLLILDNADDLQMVGDFLPTTGKGHLMLTTRAGATGSIAQNFPIEKMNEQEGVYFLLRRAKILKTANTSLTQVSSPDQTLATAIVKELDGFPLALDQAGAYIEETPSTLEAYLKSYRRRHLELLGERGSDRYHHLPVAATWSLNFKEVERLDPPAADLLCFLAFLAPDVIPEDLIVAGASKLGPQLEALATDETLLDRPIKTLSRYSLVQRKLDQRLLVIHRLVQDIFKTRIDDETRRQWVERTVRAVNQAFPLVEFATWPQCERYLPHALACAALIDDYPLNIPETARLLSHTALYLEERAYYEQAEPLLERALAIYEQALGPDHPDTARSLDNLAQLYSMESKYEQAEPLQQRALLIWEQTLGPDHPDTATCLNNLAALYYNQSKYEQAEPLYQRALAIDEKVYGPSHLEVATDLNNLAELYGKQGKYDQAEPLLKRALTIIEQALGPDHPNTATCLNNLALLYYRQNKYEQTEPLLKHALVIWEQALGPDHPRTKSARANYANLLEEMKRNKK